MKNIHVIPTSSPSKIFYIAENFHLEKGQLIEPKSYHNVYITSDEEITEGDWFLTKTDDIIICGNKNNFTPIGKKIILTTDPDLIKDGVQAIDDNFLEWFVKNPTCEEVEVKNPLIANVSDFGYKIIIPQEEPKQETLGFQPLEINFANEIEQISEYDKGRWYGRIEGAKWQAKKMFNNKEVLELLLNRPGPYLTDDEIKEWFEQFKKK